MQLTSIAHIAGLEIHDRVMIAPDAGTGIRRVFYGVPGRCVAVFNITGKKRFTNSITGERIGGLARLLAIAAERGASELAMAESRFAATPRLVA